MSPTLLYTALTHPHEVLGPIGFQVRHPWPRLFLTFDPKDQELVNCHQARHFQSNQDQQAACFSLEWRKGVPQFSSVQSLSCVQLFATPWTEHARLPCASPNPGACSNSCPSSQWCHPTISSSVIPFSYLPSSPASRSFPISPFFTSHGQNIGASASALVLPMNIQDWLPLELTDLISLQSKGLSRVFSNTTVQKHQFFGTQPSLWSNSHIHTWLLEKPELWLDRPLWQSNVSAI